MALKSATRETIHFPKKGLEGALEKVRRGSKEDLPSDPRGKASWSQGVRQNWDGTEPKRSVIYMVVNAAA
ncbi:hypothetical protein TNCV_2666891 [Trichonephila clavipes]|nr:hypothetical protein TNCV_2666891 [Trichonephila clavipes]